MRTKGIILVWTVICVSLMCYFISTSWQSVQKITIDDEMSGLNDGMIKEMVENILKSPEILALLNVTRKYDSLPEHLQQVEEKMPLETFAEQQMDKQSSNRNLKTSLAPDGFFNPESIPSDLGLSYIAPTIPGELIEYVKNMKSQHKRPDCTVQMPKKNFVYIKTHKTASDTLSALFRRFVYQRNLSEVLPLGGKFSLGWPYDLKREYHRPSKTGGFNVLLDHSKYTEKYMKEIMPEDTVYITSWRETFSHLKSAMAYMSIRQWSGIQEEPPDGMEVFLKDLKRYDDIYKILPPENPFRKKYECIPGDISMAQNSMAADLGFPVGFPKGVYPDYSENFTAIKEWLEHSNQVFSVVLLSDYFHHSLIMLKRMMCWSTKDILYERLNSWNTKYRPEYRQELVDNFRRWSAADYLAFELFNKTLWDRIVEWGHDDFMAELTQYEKTLNIAREFCSDVRIGNEMREYLEITPSNWDSGFKVNHDDCHLMKYHMRDTVKQQYDDIPVQVEDLPPRDVPGC